MKLSVLCTGRSEDIDLAISKLWPPLMLTIERSVKIFQRPFNNMPAFIVSDPQWEKRFKNRNLPIIGDDIKSQMGATIVHRILANLFRNSGVKLLRTYQLNTGGNTDFLNMLDRNRLVSKKESKTESVQSQLGVERLSNDNIHIGPGDWVAWQKDNKIYFICMEGSIFGDIPMDLALRLSVVDSPNSGGVAVDGIRCCKLAIDRKAGGFLYGPSAYFMKPPPDSLQMKNRAA